MRNENSSSDFKGVGDLLDRLVHSNVLPGASVLIHEGGEETFFHASGLKDVVAGDRICRNTIFRLFSMTKPVTAAAVMALVDAGTLRLDDTLAAYVPELAELRVGLPQNGDPLAPEFARAITLRDLLTHTAGFTYWFYPDSPISTLYVDDPAIGWVEHWRFDPALNGSDGLAQAMSRLPLVARPGERWHYSMSLDVAGIVVERASGKQLGDFMRSAIFEPLAMNDTAFFVKESQADRLASLYRPKAEGGLDLVESGEGSPLLQVLPGHSGGGGLISTIDDYARFAEMLRQRGELGGRRVLSEASVEAMMTNQLDRDQLAELPALAVLGLGGTGDGLGFGFGGAVAMSPPANGVPVFPGEYTWGGGASTSFWVDPANELTVVFMTQVQPPPSAEMIRDQLHSAVYDAMGLTGRSLL